MKIRTDFVSNSSSTSFVIITNNGFERNDFLELMGVNDNSPLTPLFDTLYYEVRDHMQPVHEHARRSQEAADEWQEVLNGQFSQEIIDRIIKADESGSRVYVGKLDSENGYIEGFFCTDSFEVENEKIYFNALECSW